MFRTFLRHGFYPLVLLVTLSYLVWALQGPPELLGRAHGAFMAGLVVLLVVLEACWPLQARWRMTPQRFLRRDLPFLLLGAATIGLGNAAAGWLVVGHGLSAPTHWLTGLPVPIAAALTLLVSDGLWYALHRFSHEGRGPLGRWMWRVHAAHHLPGQVYVLMHAVAHPLNTVFVRLLLTVPPWLMGVSPEALYAAQVVTGVQGLVSHFNLDSRAGWLNHALVGTELHRWHHAVGVSGNYAAVLSLWDQLFGSFVYRPGEDPSRLGVEQSASRPGDMDLAAILLDPLLPERTRKGPRASTEQI